MMLTHGCHSIIQLFIKNEILRYAVRLKASLLVVLLLGPLTVENS